MAEVPKLEQEILAPDEWRDITELFDRSIEADQNEAPVWRLPNGIIYALYAVEGEESDPTEYRLIRTFPDSVDGKARFTTFTVVSARKSVVVSRNYPGPSGDMSVQGSEFDSFTEFEKMFALPEPTGRELDELRKFSAFLKATRELLDASRVEDLLEIAGDLEQE
jgi:hypothetical protein